MIKKGGLTEWRESLCSDPLNIFEEIEHWEMPVLKLQYQLNKSGYMLPLTNILDFKMEKIIRKLDRETINTLSPKLQKLVRKIRQEK